MVAHTNTFGYTPPQDYQSVNSLTLNKATRPDLADRSHGRSHPTAVHLRGVGSNLRAGIGAGDTMGREIWVIVSSKG